MTTLYIPTNLQEIDRAFSDLRRTYATAGAHAILEIDRRLNEFSRAHPLPSLDEVARELKTVQCVLAVNQALNDSNYRMVGLMAQRVAGIDFSMVWPMLLDMAKETALYIGGGAVIGGAVGGLLGSLAGGIGAAPGVALGAAGGMKLAGVIMALMGLLDAAKEIVHVVPAMCMKMVEGFAMAWRAGLVKEFAPAEYELLMASSTESFAEGKILLIVAILTVISARLGKKDAARLIKQLGEGKLGPKFGSWVQAKSKELVDNPGLKPKSAAAEIGTAKAPQPDAKAPAALEPPKTKEKVKAEGEAKVECCFPRVAKPVNPITGSKILDGATELDFALPAPLPLMWQRMYSSAQGQAGWMGPGWSTPLSIALQVDVDKVVVLDAFVREITFSVPHPGEAIYSPSENITLKRTGERSFELIDADGNRQLFALADTEQNIARLVGRIDANGNQLGIVYNQRRLPERVEDGAGNVFRFAFEDVRGHPRLRSIGVTRGAQADHELLVQYEYDVHGNLAQVSNGEGDILRQFAYRNHVLVEHSQPGGLVSRYEYDDYRASGKVTRNWTNDGQSWDLRYLAQETIVTDNLGREQRYRFDHKGRMISQVDAAGGVTTRQLDRNGKILVLTDPGGRNTSYRYDERGRVIRIETAGQGTGIVYDQRFDKPALITDAAGACTALRYDEFGNLSSVTDALGHRTSYRYDELGLPVRVTDAAGGVKLLRYNRAAQLISYTDCSGNSTHFSYDDKGRLASTTDAGGNVIAYSYERSVVPRALTQPEGASERYEHDALGRLVAHVDALGNRTSYVLDSDGKPLKRIDARGGVLEYRYDEARRIAELINENGDAHRFVYDALDRLIEETGFDARLTRYRYDDSGSVIGKEEHGSTERTALTRIDSHYLRDGSGRLIEKTISRATGDAQAEQIRLRYGYDAVGRMTDAANADAAVSLRYDAVGQLVCERTRTRDHLTVISHAYDELGNRIQTVLPDGRVLNNLFYGSGHLHQINIDGDVVTDIERDKLHRATSRTQGALTSQFQYDPVGRLLAQVAGHLGVGEGARPVIARRYEYDETGNLLAIDDQRNGRKTYTYDVIGRIMTAVQPSLEERFAFDPAHNMLDSTAASGGRVEGNRVRVFEDKRYAYDAHGNLTEKLTGKHTQLRLEWNAAHQLVKSVTTRHADEPTPVVQAVKYFYDPFGRRIAKKDAFGITRFCWDGNRLLSEARGRWQRTYVYEANSFVPLAQVETLVDEAGEAAECKVRHIHTDHLGTPNEVTDQDGEITWSAEYKAWGNVLREVRSEHQCSRVEILDAEAAQSSLERAQPVRFLGQFHDSETGLHYNRFRYYDAEYGRFISVDPIGLAGGINSYRYAPNPSGWTDPLGLENTCACGGNTGASEGWPGTGGAGPVAGTIGITDQTAVGALRNYRPKGNGVEFVFDPATHTFVTGRPRKGLFNGSPHEQLAQSIGAADRPVVGGTMTRGERGEFFTTENSGHYGQNWTNATRTQFQEWLNERLGAPVNHHGWGNK